MVTSRVDRRLAAILAADVVGYATLIERDETSTLARLKAHRQELVEPLVAEHRGRIVKLMGDGMLCEFASVVEAVSCAVLVQRGIGQRERDVPETERIRFRIGINLGDIVCEDGDIFGDGVNVAARLEQLAEPGGIVLSGVAFDQVEGKLALRFTHLGEHALKNIARPVRVYRAARAAAGPAPPRPALRRAAEQRPAVAVLPFSHLSDDPRWERLADGISGDVITDLARYPDFLVIARDSTFAYKGKAIDVRQVGKRLGVRYVLSGSLQATDERVRITAQLVDAATGAHVWAARYERPQGELFAIQDEVTEQVVNTLGTWGGQLARAGGEVAKRKPPASLEAYDLYLLGLEHKHRFTKASSAEAIRLLARAVELDPDFARAWTSLGLAYAVAAINGFTDDPVGAGRSWHECTEKALALDSSDPKARISLGDLRARDGDLDGAAEEYRRALAAAPSDADVLAFLAGSFALVTGDPQQAAELARRAMRLNPSLPPWYSSMLGRAEYVRGAYRESIAAMHQASRAAAGTLLFLAMAHAQLGEAEEAQRLVARLAAEFPSFTVEGFIRDYPVTNPPALAAIREGATKAGWKGQLRGIAR